MNHNCHHHHHHTASDPNASSNNIKLALLVNGTFTIIEVVGGFYTGSIAILSDALHDLGDTIALGLALVLQRRSSKLSNSKFSYGYKRLSLISAVATAAILVVGSIAVLWHAVPRLFAPTQPKAEGMLLLALLGIVVNGFAFYRVKRGKTLNEQVISWHMLEDAMGWVAVLIISVIMMFWNIPILDPLLSIFFTCFILVGIFRTIRETISVFMQAAPTSIDLPKLTKTLSEIDGVTNIHDLHFWSLDGENHVLTLHAAIKGQLTLSDAQLIKEKIKAEIERHGNIHVTLEIESDASDCAQVHCVQS
jgi:cobalt-zinc-cadmium efflux system protein